MHELANRFVELQDVTSEIARSLRPLPETSDWASRFSLMDAIIAQRLNRLHGQSLRTAWAWQKLRDTDGMLNIRLLASESGCSQKHLVAQFRDYVGVSPKVAARVIPFNRAVKLIERRGSVNGARLALDCGYYDQSHFIRDFRAFAGCTPTELSDSMAGPTFAAGERERRR
jgi:AraC-like DNA-binding protein